MSDEDIRADARIARVQEIRTNLAIMLAMTEITIYDIEIDGLRPVTKRDIHIFGAVSRAWGRVCTASKQPDDQVLRRVIEEAFNELMVSIGVDEAPRGPLPDDTPVRGGKIELRERGIAVE